MPPELLHDSQPKLPRKQKQREPEATDLADKMIALKRRTADSSRTRDRAERQLVAPPSKSPVIRRPVIEADPEEFSRRLNISAKKPTSPRAPLAKNTSKLYNPQTDPIPMRRTAEPEAASDATSSSYAPRSSPAHAPAHGHGGPQRQLFDHRKDDPVRFSVLARPSSINGRPTPTPKSSGDYVSASSTSSYAHSIASSSFTLSSGTTDGSSASSALFDRGRPHAEDPGNNAFAVQLKKLYRGISALETRILNEDLDEGGDEGRVLLKKEIPDEDAEVQKWKKLIGDHKRLAEMMHNLLEISLAPSVPASLRNIPTKYNIIIRLWTHAFYKLLESLRRASFSSPLALEHLQDYIYYAYTFYTGLLEEQTLRTFRAGWLEALGDLARYRMAVAAMVTGTQSSSPEELTAAAVSSVLSSTASPNPTLPPDSSLSIKSAKSSSASEKPAARIDDSPSPSIGLAAARLLDVEPEKERWRGIARDWYAQGLADTPGTGKLHHHLGLLSREKDGDELRGMYHFVKSMTTLHPFPTSRESILPIWSPAAQQARLSNPSTRATDLFVLLHGMLFTNIQRDDFTPTLARFLERLEMEGESVEEREWVMMGVINLGAVLEYGRASSVIRRAGGMGAREGGSGLNLGGAGVKVVVKRATTIAEDEKMDIDEDGLRLTAGAIQASPATSEVDEATTGAEDYPAPFKLAAQLTFAMLSYVLEHPTRKASPFARATLNPYLTVVLTFLTTISKYPATLATLERSIPWAALARFFASVPSNVMLSQGLNKPGESTGERWVMLTTGCAPPLDEDWCMRGMEWVGRRVFERGYWKSGEERGREVEILEATEGGEVTDGIIEDEDDEDDVPSNSGSETGKRWARIVRSAVGISQVVDGFTWVEGTKEWRVEGALERKVQRWEEEDRIEQEAEEKRRRGTRWAEDAMEVDEVVDDSEESEEDEDDSEEVKALKARRRYLRSLQSAPVPSSSSPSRRRAPRAPKKQPAARAALPIVPGYTVLVVDTNILLSSLSMLASVIESFRWTVLIPVPVIMELDGLSANTSPLGEAAQSAMAYISSHIRSHSTSLKVQTSKGNYLTSLSIRTEQVDFQDKASWERNMDDLILRAAIWQDEHWLDRSAMLKADGMTKDTSGAIKVVLLSLDRNLRLKARSKQLPAASEQDLASILATGT